MGILDKAKEAVESFTGGKWKTMADYEKEGGPKVPGPKKAIKVQKTVVETVPEDDMPATGPDGKYLKPRPYKSGGSVSASRRADGIAQRGKTRGKMV